MNSLNDDLSKQHYGAFKYKCILMNDLCSIATNIKNLKGKFYRTSHFTKIKEQLVLLWQTLKYTLKIFAYWS